jgi:hypothetical protein
MTRKTIPIAQLTRGPMSHEKLSISVTARINYLCQALDEVYPQSLEKWLDEFQRDANPESEVLWWEWLTRCYLGYTEPKDLTSEQKQATFKILFTLAMGSDPQAMGGELARLPDGASDEILRLMGHRTQ